jgi:hypothetical protein
VKGRQEGEEERESSGKFKVQGEEGEEEQA